MYTYNMLIIYTKGGPRAGGRRDAARDPLGRHGRVTMLYCNMIYYTVL